MALLTSHQGSTVMAGLSQDPKSQVYRVFFRYGGKAFNKSLKTTDADEADRRRGRIEDVLLDLERGKLELPPRADLWEFVWSGGKRTQKVEFDQQMTFGGLWEWYFEKQTLGAKEANTLATEKTHRGHFLRILATKMSLRAIIPADLQEYVNTRAAEKWHGKPISRDTIAKEIATLRMVWGRAAKLGLAPPVPALDALVFPKSREKVPFQTWAEIERKLATGKWSKTQIKEQWDSLYLDLEQTKELLGYVRDNTKNLLFHPLMVFLAHTGARKSEAIRSMVHDFDFAGRTIMIREKKREQGKITYRRVEMSNDLAAVMREYLDTRHVSGQVTFAYEPDQPIAPNSLYETFDWFFRDSKWSVLRGYHVLRHSFASNLALKGIDQRVIDALLGHTTEEMRQRYRHLFPHQRAAALTALFG